MRVTAPKLTKPRPSPEMRRLTSKANFDLAWSRLSTAREPSYKWYYRRSLAIAEKSRRAFLARIRGEITNDSFNPDAACLISEPKPTSLLRHKAILSVGDLFLYQAICNIVANKVHEKIEGRYYKSVFGNIYNGPTSRFFLRRWEDSYKKFNDANRAAFDSGSTWLVQFDFASFYDTIGHDTLAHILNKDFGIGDDVCSLLTKLLKKWSNAVVVDKSRDSKSIYLASGIPQGPPASPILAEAMLAYIDRNMLKGHDIVYLRYADDIRIWAKSESDVRLAAAVLDRFARNIGIFPQAKKFGIEEVTDVESIIKHVSVPNNIEEPDDEEFDLLADEFRIQPSVRKLWDMLRAMTEDKDIANVTLFKYLLGSFEATSGIGEKLANLIYDYPHLAESSCYYLERIEKPTAKLLENLISSLGKIPGYPWLTGRVLRVIWKHRFHLSGQDKVALRLKIGKLPRTGFKSDAQLAGVAFTFKFHLTSPKIKELDDWVSSESTSWWSIVYFILECEARNIGDSALLGLLQKLLAHPNREVSRAAAFRLCLLGVQMPNVAMDSAGECKEIFKQFGLDGKVAVPKSRLNGLIELLLRENEVVGNRKFKINWDDLLGSAKVDFEKYVVLMLAEHRFDRNLFIQYWDAALEPLVEILWTRLGCTNLNHDTGQTAQSFSRAGKFRKNTDFRQRMPNLAELMTAVNDLRNHGHASHRHNTQSGSRPSRNRSVAFKDVHGVLTKFSPALLELQNEFPE